MILTLHTLHWEVPGVAHNDERVLRQAAQEVENKLLQVAQMGEHIFLRAVQRVVDMVQVN